MRSIEVPATAFTLRDDGVLVAVERLPDLDRTEEIVNKSVAAARQLLEPSVDYPVLWDIRGLRRFYGHGWPTFLRHLEQGVVAMAIIVDGDSKNVLGSFGPVIRSLLLPVAVFTDMDEAEAWIAQYATA